MNCYALGCFNSRRRRQSVAEGVSFHRVPVERYEEWMVAIRRQRLTKPNRNRRVCSEHFLETDFIYTNYGKRLKPSAIPSQKLSFKTSVYNTAFRPPPEPEIETVHETPDGSESDSNSSIIDEKKPTVIPFQSLHNKLIQPMGVKLPANVSSASVNKPLALSNSGSNVQNLPKIVNPVSFQDLQKIIQSLGIKTSANVVISTENNSLLKSSQTPNVLHNLIITPISGKLPVKLQSKAVNSKENNIEETIVISDSEEPNVEESKQNDAGEPNEVYDSDGNLEDSGEPYNEVDSDEENDKIISEEEYLKTIGLVEAFHSYSKGPGSAVVPTEKCAALKEKLRVCKSKLKAVQRGSARRKLKIVSQRQTILELQKQLSMTTKALQAAHRKLNFPSSHSGRN